MVKGQTIKVSWFMTFEMSTNFYVIDMSRNKAGHKSKSLEMRCGGQIKHYNKYIKIQSFIRNGHVPIQLHRNHKHLIIH